MQVSFYLPNKPLTLSTHERDKANKEILTLTFKDKSGAILREFSSTAKEKHKKLKAEKGFNRFNWDMRTTPPRRFDGMMLWANRMIGYKVIPGEYYVELTYGDEKSENYYQKSEKFSVLVDPRTTAISDDFNQQIAYAKKAWQTLDDTHKTIGDIRVLRKNIKAIQKKLGDEKAYQALNELSDKMLQQMDDIENTLYQTKSKARQDPLGFPVKLNDKLNSVYGSVIYGNMRPTKQQLEVTKIVTEKILVQLERFNELQQQQLPKFNQLMIDLKVPTLAVSS